MIAATLKGAVSQRLVPSADGNGRIACCEVLRMTGRVRDMIVDPAQTGRLPEVIAEGAFYGMQSFDQHLFEHLKAGRVAMQTAVQFASSPARLQAAGGRGRQARDDDGRPRRRAGAPLADGRVGA
jgi:twitching motility protein PilT